jgi:hypothetical protein
MSFSEHSAQYASLLRPTLDSATPLVAAGAIKIVYDLMFRVTANARRDCGYRFLNIRRNTFCYCALRRMLCHAAGGGAIKISYDLTLLFMFRGYEGRKGQTRTG